MWIFIILFYLGLGLHFAFVLTMEEVISNKLDNKETPKTSFWFRLMFIILWFPLILFIYFKEGFHSPKKTAD